MHYSSGFRRLRVENLRKLRGSFPALRSTMRDINRFIYSIDPWTARLAWLGTIAQGLRGVATVGVAGFAVSYASEYLKAGGGLTYGLLLGGLAAWLVYTVSADFIRFLAAHRQATFNIKFEEALRERRMAKMESLDIGRLTDPEFIELSRKATRGQNVVDDLWGAQMRLVAGALGLAASLSVIAVLDPVLLVIAVLPVAPNAIASLVTERKLRDQFDQAHKPEYMKNQYYELVMDVQESVQARLLKRTGYYVRRFREVRDRLVHERLVIEMFSRRMNMYVSVFQTLTVVGATAYLGNELVLGAISLGQLVALIGCMALVRNSLFGFARLGVDLTTHLEYYGHYRAFLETQPVIDESSAHDHTFTVAPAITITDATFNYPRSEYSALEGCSLSIAPGEKIVIAGDNGSGKSTLLDLIAKIREPNSGSVLVGGIPLSSITQQSLGNHLAYGRQRSYPPRLTLTEVITGDAPENVDQAKFRAATAIAGTDAFVEPLHRGYATRLGYHLADGKDFSGGQEQRLQLAGLLYRLLEPEVSIGIFDEPMSDCDPPTRERFYRALAAMDKTIIVVAHDPLYLALFDRLIVMEHGKIILDTTDKVVIEKHQVTQMPGREVDPAPRHRHH